MTGPAKGTSRVGRRWRRWAVRGLLVLLSLIGVLIVGLLLLVGTQTGTRLGIQGFLGFYNPMIPGEIAVEKITGTLLGGVSFDGVALRDRKRAPIIEAKTVQLQATLAQLLTGTVHVPEVKVTGARLFIRSYDGESTFVDLGPSGEEEVEEPDTPLEAIILPISILVEDLSLKDIGLFIVEGKSQLDLIHVNALDLHGTWVGGKADYTIANIAADLLKGTLVIDHLDAKARLEKGRTWVLTDGRVKTNRGDLSIPEARFNQITLDGDMTARAQSDTDRFVDLVSLPKSHPVDADVSVTIRKAQDFVANGEISLATASVGFDGTLNLAARSRAGLSFNLRDVTPGLFGSPVAGLLGGEGQLNATWTEGGELSATGRFQCRECQLDRIGPLALDAEVSYGGERAGADLQLEGTGLQVQATAKIDDEKRLFGKWHLHADALGPVGELISLKGVKGNLSGDGACSGTVEAPDCDYSLTVKGFAAQDISLASLEGRGRVAYANDTLDLTASVGLKNAVFPPIEFRKGSIELSTREGQYLIAVAATARNGRVAAVSGAVAPGEETTIQLHRLKSSLFGIPLRLLSPASLTVGNEAFRLSKGLSLQVGRGKLTANGAVSKTRLSNVRVTARSIDLGLFSRFVDKTRLAGVVDASIEGSGLLGSPTLAVEAKAKRFAFASSPPKRVQVTSSLKSDTVTFDVALGGKEKPVLEASGSLGLHLDLQLMKAEWREDRPARISWNLRDLSSSDLQPFLSLPDGTGFHLDGSGDLDFHSKRDFLLAGNLAGWLQEKRMGRAPLSATLEITPRAQQIQMDLGDDEHRAVHLDLATKVVLSRLMAGDFEMDDSRISLQMGKARLEASGSYSRFKPGTLRLSLDDFHFEMLQPFIDDLPLTGRLMASGTITRDGESLTLNLDASAQELVYDHIELGSLVAQTDWRSNVATLKLDARQKTHAVLSASAEVPLTIDPDSFRPGWLKNLPHTLRWNVTEPDLAELLGSPQETGIGITKIKSTGEIKGAISDLRGQGTVFATLQLADAEAIPVTASWDMTEDTQQLHLRARGIAAHDLEATVKTDLCVDRLLAGELDPTTIPVTGSLKADGDGHITASTYYVKGQESALLFSAYNFNLNRLEPYFYDLNVSGYLDAKGELTLVGGKPDMDITASVRNLQYGSLRADLLSARAGWHERRVALQVGLDQERRHVVDLSAEIPLGFDAASLTPSWLPDETHGLRWTMKGLDVGDLLPDLESTTMRLSSLWSTGQIHGPIGDLRGTGNVNFALRYGPKDEMPGEMSLTLDGSSQKLSIGLLGATSKKLHGHVETRADLNAILAGKQQPRDIPISGELDAKDLNLSVLNVLDLDPVFDLKGRATATLRADGTLKRPELRGRLVVRKGEATIGSLADPFTDIAVDIRLTGNQVTAKNISMKSGVKGIAAFALNGNISKGGQFILRAVAKTRDFRLAFTGMPAITLDTDTTLRLRSSPSLTDIRVRLKETLIRHVSATSTSVKDVPENANTKVIDKASLEAQRRRRAKDAKKESSNRDPHVTKLSVKTDKPLKVQGAKLDTSWRIGIQSEHRGGKANVKGKAYLNKGEFTLFANTFQIEKASAYFKPDGGVDPHIDVLASSQLPDTKVFVRIDGTVGAPRLRLYSEPAMPEETLLTMLISGSSEDAAGSGGGVLAGVLQMKYPKLTNMLYERFGIDRVAVGSSASGEGTVVKLGQRVNDKLFMVTGFNLNADDDENDFDVTWEYSVTDSITVDTMTGNETSSVDIGWRVPLGRKGKREIKKAKREKGN